MWSKFRILQYTLPPLRKEEGANHAMWKRVRKTISVVTTNFGQLFQAVVMATND